MNRMAYKDRWEAYRVAELLVCAIFSIYYEFQLSQYSSYFSTFFLFAMLIIVWYIFLLYLPLLLILYKIFSKHSFKTLVGRCVSGVGVFIAYASIIVGLDLSLNDDSILVEKFVLFHKLVIGLLMIHCIIFTWFEKKTILQVLKDIFLRKKT